MKPIKRRKEPKNRLESPVQTKLTKEEYYQLKKAVEDDVGHITTASYLRRLIISSL